MLRIAAATNKDFFMSNSPRYLPGLPQTAVEVPLDIDSASENVSSDFDTLIRNNVYYQQLTARRKSLGTTSTTLSGFA
jgi:hypothetical protein